MDPNTQTLFQTWLNSGSHDEKEVRKLALKAALDHFGKNRAYDCSPEQTASIQRALGIRSPDVELTVDMARAAEPPVPMTFSFDNRGPVDFEIVLKPEQAVTMVSRGYTVRVLS